MHPARHIISVEINKKKPNNMAMARFWSLVFVLPCWAALGTADNASSSQQHSGNTRVMDLLSRAAAEAAQSRRAMASQDHTNSRRILTSGIITDTTTFWNDKGRALQADAAMQICEEDVPIVEEATSSVAFNCSCTAEAFPSTATSLNCLSDCSLCNQAGDVCGYTEYSETYYDGGAVRTISQSFQYTEGLLDSYVLYERSGCKLDDEMGIECTGCDVYIDGQQCSSCTLVPCMEGFDFPYQSPLADCSNIQQDATLDLCNEIPSSDIFQIFDGVGFEQCSGWRPWTPTEICEEELWYAESSGFQCDCVPNTTGRPAVKLDCLLDCNLCTEDHDTCGIMQYDELYENGDDMFRTITQTFQYTNGRSENVIYQRRGCYLNDEFFFDCSACDFVIDGEHCSSCEMATCSEGTDSEYQAPVVDCGNIIKGSTNTMNLCDEALPSGVFHVFSYDEFSQCIEDNQVTAVELCEKELPTVQQTNSELGYDCSCSPSLLGGTSQATLSCVSEDCILCNNSEYEVCGEAMLDKSVSDSEVVASVARTFKYTRGRREEIKYEKTGCVGEACSGCTFYVDGQKCSACSLQACSGGPNNGSQLPTVDCQNILSGATADLCQEQVHGLFEAIIPDSFNVCMQKPAVASACLDSAAPIVPDGSTIIGSTTGIEFDGTEACESKISSPGLWYHVEGEGVPFTVSTCDMETNFATKISVFTGPCGTLECVKESAQDQVCQYGSKSQTVTWFGTKGVMYHIRVHGVESEVGEFGLRVVSGWAIDFGLSVPAARNNACAQAIGPLETDGSLTVGSTLSSSLEITCQEGPSPGIWYYVESGSATNGRSILSVSTCTTETKFSSSVSVMSGDCNERKCIDDVQMAPCEKGSTVSWSTAPGEKYYVLVHGTSEEEEGLFGLLVEETPALENDECIGAIEILPNGSPVNGTTRDAGIDFLAGDSSCGTPDGGGVWFSVDGTGAAIKATTCLEGTDHATTIQVFSGSCGGALQCIVADTGLQECDKSPSNAATATWTSELGSTYYILVSTREAEEPGSFELQVTEVQAPSNDVCKDAIDLLLANDSVLVGSTSNATRDFADGDSCGGALDYQGTWYSYEGKGTGVTVSTCNDVTNYETAVSVFSGSCDDLQCVGGASFSSEQSCEFGGSAAVISWFAEQDSTYFVFVHGSLGTNTVGSYGLTTTEFQVVEPNDFCLQAAPVLMDGSSLISGSTKHATQDNFGIQSCGVPMAAPGLWYTISGTGDLLHASACAEGSGSTSAISVFSGTCDNLKCITGQRLKSKCDAPSGARRLTNGVVDDDSVTWRAEANETYYLLIQGGDSLEGDESQAFELTVTKLSIAGMECQNRLFSIQNATSDATTCECAEDPESGGAVLSCASPTCQYCNSDGTVCYRDPQMGASFNSSGILTSKWEGFHYSRGRGEKFSLDHDLLSRTCQAFVDDKGCNSCELVMCHDGSDGIAIDCENLEGGAKFVGCDDYNPALVTGTLLEGRFGEGFETCLEDSISTTDGCLEAIPIVPNGPKITGSTTTLDASLHAATAPLCNVDSKAPGLWYQVEGTGRNLLASTCSQSTTYSTAMAVFSGDACNKKALGCIEASTSDLACAVRDGENFVDSWAQQVESSGSIIPWETEPGTTYYIFVFGSSDDEVGSFEMTVTDDSDSDGNDNSPTTDSGSSMLHHPSFLVMYLCIAITTSMVALLGQV